MFKTKFYYICIMMAVFTLSMTYSQEGGLLNITGYGAGYLPIGEYSSFSTFGAGGGAAVDISLFPEDSPLAPVLVKAEIAGVFNKTAQTKFTGLINLQWAVGGAYILPLSEKLSIGGGVYYGGILHILKIDSIVQGEITENFYDQAVNLQVELLLNLASGFQVALNPGYQIFFETEYLGHQPYIKAGARFGL